MKFNAKVWRQGGSMIITIPNAKKLKIKEGDILVINDAVILDKENLEYFEKKHGKVLISSIKGDGT